MALKNNVVKANTLNGKGHKMKLNKKGNNSMKTMFSGPAIATIEAGTFHTSERENNIMTHKTKKNSITNQSKLSLYRKGVNIMKKLISLILTTVVLLSITLTITGCGFAEDNTHATVTLTTSTGYADVWKTVSSLDSALLKKSEITLKYGETAHITFKCDACGNEQDYEVEEPWAQVLSCDCPEKIKDGNAKEYTAISISFTK